MRLKIVISWAPYPAGSPRYEQQAHCLQTVIDNAPQWCEIIVVHAFDEVLLSKPKGDIAIIRLKRDARDVAGGRRLPFISDVIEVAMADAQADDWGGFFNSDIIVTPSFFEALTRAHADAQEAILCHRTDILRADSDPASGRKINQKTCADGFFLRGSAWEEWRHLIPQFILGEPWWDTGMIWWAKARGLKHVHLADHEILHVKHPRFWHRKGPGAQYNSQVGLNMWKGTTSRSKYR